METQTSEGSVSPLAPEIASQACASCKLQKRKCSKGLPKCFLCSKRNWKCDYSSSNENSNSETWTWSYIVSDDGGRSNLHRITFPDLFFLDSRVLQHGQVDVARPTISISPPIARMIADNTEVSRFAARYFETVHKWMPVVSRKRFYEDYAPSALQPRADIALLFLCMKLITEIPPEDSNARTSLYYATKRSYLETETSGIFSIQVLQAGLLIAVYELGHAIYPSAYLTIGGCARYAYALGLNGKATSLLSKPFTWVELEERRRVWWAVVILDRFVNVDNPGRRFAADDPEPHDLLPVDDAAWDQGIIPSASHTLSSPSTGHMSKFALVAQAARLLGQVISHLSDNTTAQALLIEERAQLDRTIHALIGASNLPDSPDCDQVSICYSALLALHEPYLGPSKSSSITPDQQHYPRAVAEAIARDISSKAKKYGPILASISDGVSIWSTHLTYQVCVIYIRLVRETGDAEDIEALKVTKEALALLSLRWKSAGVYYVYENASVIAGRLTIGAGAYLQILEAREVMGV